MVRQYRQGTCSPSPPKRFWRDQIRRPDDGQGKPGRCIFLSRKGPGCIWAGPAYTQNRQHSNFDKNPQLALGTHQPPYAQFLCFVRLMFIVINLQTYTFIKCLKGQMLPPCPVLVTWGGGLGSLFHGS